MGNIFTKIIEGEIPSYRIAEDEHHYAFLDINPAAKGHVLVIPKEETDYLFDLRNERLQSLIIFAKKVAKGMDQALKPIRTGLIVEGLEVPHAHIHLIPIYEKHQDFSLGKKADFSPEDMEEIASTIREAVEA